MANAEGEKRDTGGIINERNFAIVVIAGGAVFSGELNTAMDLIAQRQDVAILAASTFISYKVFTAAIDGLHLVERVRGRNRQPLVIDSAINPEIDNIPSFSYDSLSETGIEFVT